MRAEEMNTGDLNRRSATRPARDVRRALAIVLASAGLLFLMLIVGVMDARPNAPTTPVQPASRTFVTAYGNTIRQVEYGLTPESVGVTSDGGYIALALTDSPSGITSNWFLKLNASGRSQWQREIECPNGAPGDYALGVSTQQLSDGGYILGGGILGCGGPYV
jgi:hypothetical protein